MTRDDFVLFIGSSDRESATSQLRADGVTYRKKLLSSGLDNWRAIVDLVKSPDNRATLAKLTAQDYATICDPAFENVAADLLDGMVDRPHVIFIHENVYLTDEQREAGAVPDDARFEPPSTPSPFDDPEDEDLDAYYRQHIFGNISDEGRQKVNSMLRERALNVMPYRTNVELSVMATSFLNDHERHLLFRFYVPSGRLYAQEFDTLLGLFREWLSQTGHDGVRQESHSTQAGQIFEFFSDVAVPNGGLTSYLGEFANFLDHCVLQPEQATQIMVKQGASEVVAERLVERFSLQGRRLKLDLKQRREERLLSLKHEMESVFVEVDGLDGDALVEALAVLVPAPRSGGEMLQMHGGWDSILTRETGAALHGSEGAPVSGPTIYNQQFIKQVVGPVSQNLSGTVNLSSEARDLLELIMKYGGSDQAALESAVQELEDAGVRRNDRMVAKSRLKRFLADLGNRGVGVGLNMLQKYIENAIGLS